MGKTLIANATIFDATGARPFTGDLLVEGNRIASVTPGGGSQAEADTVIDASDEAVRAGRATGFVFDAASAAELAGALQRAISAFARPALWKALMASAMAQDFSWEGAAKSYGALYESLLIEGLTG